MIRSSKTMNIIQKIIHLLFALSGAALVVAALCYATKYQFIDPKEAGCEEAARLVNTANNTLLYAGLVTIVLFAIVCIFGNKYRKKYYVSNLVAGIVAGTASFAITLYSMISNIASINNIKNNYDVINTVNLEYGDGSNLSTFFANLALGIQAFACVVFVLYIVYVIVKFVLSLKKTTNKVDEEKVGA